MTSYWLMKSEPGSYSIDDLARDKQTAWTGVRNYQARNFLKAMKKGDLALFYHSNANPSAIVGEMEILGDARPDPTAAPEDPDWLKVDVRFARKFKTPLSIGDIKRQSALSGMVLLNNSRLSVQPVTESEWSEIQRLCRGGKTISPESHLV